MTLANIISIMKVSLGKCGLKLTNRDFVKLKKSVLTH